MRIRSIRRLAGLAGVAAVIGLATAAETTIPESTTAELIKQDIAFLQKGLAKEPQRKQVPGLKATAMMIAYYAQQQLGGPKAAEMAGLRDQALKVAEALAAKDYAKAKDAAKALSSPATGPTNPVELHKMHKIDISEIMAPFRSDRSGGMNIERDIRAQAKTVTDIPLVATIAGRTVAIGEYTLYLPTGQAAANPARKKKWEDYTKEMLGHAKEIVSEASKPSPDKALLKKKLQALDASCTNCHNDYRD
jgi:hypothetical protein